MIHLAPAAARPSTSETQSTGLMKMYSASSRVSLASRPVRAAHSSTRSTPADSRGVWKPTSTLSWLKTGRKTAPPRGLVLALGFLFLGDLRAVELEPGQLLGGPGDDHRAPAVADGQGGRQHGAHVLGELVEELGHPGGVDVGHRYHRRLVAAADHAAAARDQRSRCADQLTDGEQLDVAGASRLQRLHGGDALRVAGDGDRRMTGEVESLALERADGRHLGEQNARAGDGSGGEVLRGGQRLVGGQRADPLHRLEADRTHHDQLARQRFEQQFGLTDQRADLRFDTCRIDEFLEVLQPGATLAAERHRVRLAGVQSIDECVRTCQWFEDLALVRVVLAGGGGTVLVVDRHVLLSPSGFRFARIARRGCRGRRPHSVWGHCDSASNQAGLVRDARCRQGLAGTPARIPRGPRWTLQLY